MGLITYKYRVIVPGTATNAKCKMAKCESSLPFLFIAVSTVSVNLNTDNFYNSSATGEIFFQFLFFVFIFTFVFPG